MGRFAASGVCTAAAVPGTSVGLTQGTELIKPKIYDILMGCSGAPADAQITHQVSRSTVAGTGGTAVTPEELDAGTANLAVQNGPTTEPTYTAGAVLLQIPIHARGTFRWVARQGGEFLIPQVVAAGIGHLKVAETSGTLAVDSCFHWEE